MIEQGYFREREFRVWDFRKKDMLEDAIEYELRMLAMPPPDEILSVLPIGFQKETDGRRFHVMDYFGTSDRIGKKLCECDIVNMYPWEDSSCQVICRAVILWNNGDDGDLNPNGYYGFFTHSHWYGTNWLDTNSYGKVLPIGGKYVEKVGNVFENENLINRR